MNTFEILARVFDLLGACTSEELDAAANAVNISPAVQACLHSLAEAKREIELRAHPPASSGNAGGRRNRVSSHTGKREKTRQANAYERKVERLMLTDGVFNTNRKLADHLNSVELGVSFHEKDGRKRMHAKLLRSLSNLSPKDRSKKITSLFRVLPKSETAGWFDVIRGNKE